MMLVTAEIGAGIMECTPCSSRFIIAAQDDPKEPGAVLEFSAQAEEPSNGNPFSSSEVDADTVTCPACLLPMQLRSNDDPELIIEDEYVCSQCHGRWLEPTRLAKETEESASTTKIINEAEAEIPSFAKRILYGVSLPERALRTLVGVTAGTTREAVKLLVPQAFQSSKSYEVAIRNSLDFLTESVGGFGNNESASENEVGVHIAKKTVGNFLDIASLTMLHVSPMWALAVVSDVAYGSSTFLHELVKELEQQGVVDSSSTIHNVDDFLDVIQKATGDAANNLDRPPFSVEELRAVVDQTRATLASADVKKLVPEAEAKHYWQSLKDVAEQENTSPLSVATAVAMLAVKETSAAVNSATTGVKVAGNLVQRNVFDHYRDSLATIRQDGMLSVLKSTYEPYVSHIWDNFAEDRPSWTETLINKAGSFWK